MPSAPASFRPSHAPSRQVLRCEADARRGSASERGYTTAWSKAARTHLRTHPLCAYCLNGVFAPARTTLATLVDHLYPHRGSQALFWWKPGWVSACAPCHNGPKQSAERAGEAALHRIARRLRLGPALVTFPGGPTVDGHQG